MSQIELRTLAVTAGCFLGSCAVIVLLTVAMGTSFAALLDGILVQHLKFGEDFHQPATIQRWAAQWAILAVACAAAVFLLQRSRPVLSARVVGSLKAAFGLAVIACSVAGYTWYLNHFLLLSFATPFLWLLLVADGSPMENQLARSALVFTAILMTLQIFPIAGTQMAYATFLMTVIGIICLYDAIKAFRATVGRLKNMATVASLIAVAAFCIFWGYRNYAQYASQPLLDLPGATLVRLPERDVQTYRSLSEMLRANCDSVVTMPGMFSLNFWTGIESPTNLNATAWPSLLDDERQRTIVEKLEKIDRLCAVYHPHLTRNAALNRDLTQSPLSSYVFENLTAVSITNEYQFMTRRVSPR